MKTAHRRICIFLAALAAFSASTSLSALESSVSTSVPRALFSRGVNLSTWFEAGGAHAISFSRYTREDLASIKSLGADVIRLPIRLHDMTSGAPEYRLDPLLFELLDQAVDWAEELGIHLILDNHSFDPVKATDPGVEKILLEVWTQMALHYKNRSDLIVYEVLNEPHGIDAALWGKVQGKVIEAIRKIDTRHWIIVGGVDFNSFKSLSDLPEYRDQKLIYTFHFYEPFLFTHQGAAWLNPSMEEVTDIPFPARVRKMPPVPKSLQATWLNESYRNYPEDGSVARLGLNLDIPFSVGKKRQVPLFCGELGVMMKSARPEERAVWYKTAREALEDRGIAWASWDYENSFGLFTTPKGGDVHSDLNIPLIKALGFTPPLQVPVSTGPVTGKVLLYSDAVERGVTAVVSSGTADLYAAEAAHRGRYGISWGAAPQYSSLSFSFRALKDLSLLREKGSVLEFWAKTTDKRMSFDVRLVNSSDGESFPWRMSSPVDSRSLPGDGAWHLVRIPLSVLKDTGAWKEKWYEPRDAFDWTRVSAVEFSFEKRGLESSVLYLDDVSVAPR